MASAWHLGTALVSLVSLLVQLVLVVHGTDVLVDDTTGRPLVGAPTRVLRFFSYFTVESNVLVIVATALLAREPGRDGAVFRPVRLAGLVGITVTFVVYLVALRPLLDLHGVAAATDVGFHIATPVLAVMGFLLFGPWPRFGAHVLVWSLAWPVVWVGYTLVHGAASGWYPYPFLDVTSLGYGVALRNVLLVAVVAVVLAAAYVAVDAVLGRRAMVARR